MIITIKLILAYLLPWLVGYLPLALLDHDNRLSFGYKFFAGFLVGMGLLTLEIFVAGIFKTSLSLQTYLILLLINFGVFELLIFKQRKKFCLPKFKLPKLNISYSKSEKVILILFILLVGFSLITNLQWIQDTPTFEFDAWNNWNLRAKVIYTEGHIPLDSSEKFFLGGGIVSYPLNDSLWKVWLANMIDGWDDSLINTTSLVYFIVLIGLFYFTLPRRLNLSVKLIATYLLASLPFVFLHAHVPYADLLFTSYLLLSMGAMYLYLESQYEPLWWISALGLAFSVWTKNEGLVVVLPVIVLINILLVIIKKINWQIFVKYILIIGVLSAPWLVFKNIYNLGLLSGDSSSFALIFNQQLLEEWFSSLFLRSHFNFLFLFALLLIVFKFRVWWQQFSLRWLVLTTGLLFILYNAIILFTDRAQDLGAVVRVNMHLAPALLFILVLLIVKIIDKRSLFID